MGKSYFIEAPLMADVEEQECFDNYRNPRDSTATLPSPAASRRSFEVAASSPGYEDEVANVDGVDTVQPSVQTEIDIDACRIGEPCDEEHNGTNVDNTNATEVEGHNEEHIEQKAEPTVGYRKRKSECLQIEVPEPDDSTASIDQVTDRASRTGAEPSHKRQRSRPLSTEELEMLEIAYHHDARIRERSRTERYRRRTIVAKASDTPLTAGIAPCSTTKLTIPHEPNLRTAARATHPTPRSETVSGIEDQRDDGLAVTAQRFSSRLREKSNTRWTGRTTVPTSPKLTHARSRSRPVGVVSATAAQASAEESKVSKQTAELESLAVETQRFGSRLRESSRTRWTGRPTVPTSPHLNQSHARTPLWGNADLNQSAIERLAGRHLPGPNCGASVSKENRPEVVNSLKEETQRFSTRLRQNNASVKWTGRVTVPRSPNLSHNRGRSRMNNTFCLADSNSINHATLDTSFKARPAPSSTRHPHSVPFGPLRPLTKPKSPTLRTRTRAKGHLSISNDDGGMYKFVARPVPRGILEEVQFTVDLGPEKVTVAHGPEFNTEKRSLERSLQKSSLSIMSGDDSAVDCVVTSGFDGDQSISVNEGLINRNSMMTEITVDGTITGAPAEGLL